MKLFSRPDKKKKFIDRPSQRNIAVDRSNSQKKKIVKRNSEFEAMRRKRQLNNYSEKVSSVRSKFPMLKGLLLALIPLVIIMVCVNLLLRNESYSIKTIEIYGNSRIPNERLNSYLEKYKDTNLVSLSRNEVFNDLRKEFLELGNINLVKVYPDLLKVEVIETLPSIVYFDFDSIELISPEGLLVGKIDHAKASLSSEEITIAATGGDPNANYVRDRIQSTIEGAFKWDEVPSEKRLETLAILKSEVDIKVNSYIEEVTTFIENTTFKDLLIFYKKGFGEENLSGEFITFGLDISETIKNEGLQIKRVGVLNKYDFAYELSDNKMIVITTRRSAEGQINDLNAIISNNQFGNGTIFDLRSVNYSIR